MLLLKHTWSPVVEQASMVTLDDVLRPTCRSCSMSVDTMWMNPVSKPATMKLPSRE